MSDWRTALSQSFKDNPIANSNNLEDSVDDKSMVDVILEAEKDPSIHFEPEDQYGLPKQLNTITKLRKDGWDNARIFKALELETIDQDETRKPGSSDNVEKKAPRKPSLYNKKRSLGQKTAEQFRRTATSSKLDQMYFLSFTQSPGSLPLEEVQELIDEYEEMAERDPIEAENWAEYIMNATGGLAGTMAEGLKAGVPWATAGATGAAIVGAATPMIPDEFATVPLSFGTGMAIGSTVFWTQQGSGMMLRNMIDRGVDDNTAVILSSLGGLFYGAIEQMQVGRLIPEGVQKEANKAITNGVIKFVKNATDKYGKDWVKNIAEEELQLGVEVITTELGAVLEGVETREAKDIWDEAVETAKQTAAGLLPMYGGKAAVNVGVDKGPATIGKIVGSLVDTSKEMELPSKVSKEEALTVESQAQQITNDKANDFNIVYNKENDGSMELSEEELIATGYNIDLNKIPVSREDENGNKFYAVKIKGENDSQGNISISSSADRSTLLEEVVESRLKQLQNSKKPEDQALVEQIRIWTDAVRKKASELGLNLRFDESVEGNIELFSDAILYTVGGFKGLSKEFEDTIYISDAITNEFIEKFGKMSDGSNVFDMLKGSESGVTAKREFQKGVDEEIKFENYIRDSFARPPPAKPTTKSKLQKKTKQMVPGENTKTPSFKKWFGKSVVQNDGVPVTMYHGSPYSFNAFATDYDGLTWFGDDPEIANVYAEQRTLYSESEDKGREQVYPVYLKVENPLVLTKDLNDNISTEEFIELTGVDISGLTYLKEDNPDIIALWEYLNDENVQLAIQEAGYDGIAGVESHGNKDFSMNQLVQEILNENKPISKEEVEKRLQDKNKKFATMAIFDPTQAKSVFNKGPFSESTPNMSYQLEPGVVDKAVGLYPDVLADKKKSDRLRLTVDRRKKNPTIGRQKNNRVEFELENGGVMILGRDKTPQDWIRQVESILSESDIIAAMNWYEEAYPSFVEEFGEAEAIPYMVAWLLGNVQASPQQALSNTFLGAEQLKAELPSFKSAGTGPVAKNIKDVLQGKRAEKGAGAKLYDFLDSALGKKTRTIMQDDKRGLSPVAIDRHTFRDAGFADAIIKNILRRLAIDKDKVKRLRYDTRGSAPSPTQYEYALEYMNNLTDQLNQLGYMGGNLKPHQVQAIGWTAIARMSESSDGQSIPDAMRLQQPTLAYEVEFGNNTPYSQKYGPEWGNLPSSEQTKVTDEINKNIVSNLAKELGLTIKSSSTKSLGFWGDESAPNATINVRGSSQAIKGLMNSLGYLLQQDEIGLINKSPKNKGLGLVWGHPELSNPDIQQAVYDIIRESTDSKITPGALFEVVDGTPSIIVSTLVNQDNANSYNEEIEAALENIRTELGMELTLSKFGSNYESTKNNWKQSSNGQRYRDKISETHKHDLLDRLDNHYRPQIEQSIESALKRNSEQQRKTRQLVPDPDLAAEINAAEQVDKSLELSDATISDKLKEYIFDTMYPLVSWQGDIQSQFLGDARIRDHQNVNLASELFVGKVPEIIRDINKDIIDSNNPESFISKLVNAGISTEDFNLYLHTLHAQERNDHVAKNNEELQDGGSGMTNNQAKLLKRELNKKYGLKKLRTFVKEFREKVIDASLDKRLEAGLIDQESYDRLKSTYKNYVPLFRVMDNKQAILEESKSKVGMFDIKGPEFKKSRGSTREVQNILVSAVEQLHSAVVRSEKNLVNKRLLSLIESYPSESFEVVGVPHRPIYDKDGEIDYMVPIEGVRDNEDYIHVKVDGQTKRIVFKGEQGLRIANAMKGLGVSSGSKYLYAFNNYLRYVNTIANPEFIITNFVRDVQTAGVNIGAEQGSAVLGQALSPKNLKNSWKAVFNVVRGADTDSEWAELYERMRRAGGKTGFFDYESISDKLSKLEKDLQRVEDKGIGVKSAGKSILNFVENLNDATESAVRLTLFKAMLDNGYSEEQAASGAKNVTINFNRKGQIGGWLNSLYLFSNAGLQGSYRIFGVLKNSKGARKAVAGLAALGITESILNHMASEDDDEYEKLNDFEKDNYYIMRYGPGDKYFKMRLPYGYNVFKVVGNIAGDIAWNQMQGKPVEMDKQMSRFLGAINASFNPLGSGPIEQMIVPTFLEPIIQLGTNTNFYGGRIKPENPYGPEKAEVEKYWGRTPDIYKESAQYLFKLTGGKIRYDRDGEIDHAVRGWGGWLGDWSPETFEWWVKYLGGGLGQTVVRSVNTVGGIATGDADFSKAAFLRHFYGKVRKDSEKRALYDYEKQMGRNLFDGPTRLKYETYLKSYKDKGNLTNKEYKQRRKKFIKAQKEVEKTWKTQ